jgi:hypothetical protein
LPCPATADSTPLAVQAHNCKTGNALVECSCKYIPSTHRLQVNRQLHRAPPHKSLSAAVAAGNEGLQEGQEVSISYGPWPAEVFTTLFGFVPTPNPHDQLVLYTNLLALAQQVCQLLLQQLQSSVAATAGTLTSTNNSSSSEAAAAPQQPVENAAEDTYRQLLEQVLTQTQPGWEQQLQEQLQSAAAAADGGSSATGAPQQQQFIRLVATAEGLDARLGAAYQVVMSAVADVLQEHLAAGATPAPGTAAAAAAAGAVPTAEAAAAHENDPQCTAAHAPSDDKEGASAWLQQQLQGVTLHTLVTHRLQELQQQVQPEAAATAGAQPAEAAAGAADGVEMDVPQEHLQLVQQYREQKWDTAQRVLERMTAQPPPAAP